MKIPLTIAGIIAFSITLCAQDSAEAPTEVKLTSGTMLRRVEVVRFEFGLVVLKHQGGIDPIRLNYIAEPYRSQLVAYEKATKGEKRKDETVKAIPSELRGQVFITTRGGGAYKLGNVSVLAFPAALKDSLIEAQKQHLPTRYATMGVNYANLAADAYEAWQRTQAQFVDQVAASAITDSDGNYSFILKNGEQVVLLAVGSRKLARGTEYYSWLVDANGSSVNLTNHNLWSASE